MAAVGTQMRAPSAPGTSRLAMMQERMRENLRQEKESRMMELVARQEADREERINRVKGSSATNSLSSSMNSLNFSGAGQGRVRKMLEERRKNPQARSYPSPKGIDKSYPLDPVKREQGKPPANKRITGRGVSMDRGIKKVEDTSMNRSKSQFTLRANRGDSRQPVSQSPGTLGIPQKQYKSTSSLSERATPRGPSPGPPSSTKSSPGPRVPITFRNALQIKPQRKDSVPIPGKNTLSVNGYSEDTLDAPVSPNQSKGGFLSKIGFNKSKKNNSLSPTVPVAPPRANRFTETGKRSPIPPPTAQPLQRKSESNLPQCKICGRSFAEDRIQKHQQICSKSKSKAKKRKVFDPAKMRTRGTEAEKYVLRGDHKKQLPKPKKKNWRKTHDDLIQTLRAAKGVAGAVAPPTDTSDYITCPHCGRKFNEAAADRHIPKCSSIKSNKKR